MQEIYNYFPKHISEHIKENVENIDELEEIRIRIKKPIIVRLYGTEKILDYEITENDINKIFGLVCENSIYSYQQQISEGFITINGGHRVGISGSCVRESDKVININYINSLNFRVAKQIIGCGDCLVKYILNGKSIYNTLIISPPGAGKTTLLRDTVRQLSSIYGFTVGLVDERSEIASLYKGTSKNEIGIRTDVMDNVSKNVGMKMLVRSMTPQVIVADEIGRNDDIDAINYAICSGCKGIFTAHGAELADLSNNKIINKLLDAHILELIVILDEKKKSTIKKIYKLHKESLEYKAFYDY